MTFDHLLLKVDLDIDLNHDQNDHDKTILVHVQSTNFPFYITFKRQNGKI